jgi:hypothetical protein
MILLPGGRSWKSDVQEDLEGGPNELEDEEDAEEEDDEEEDDEEQLGVDEDTFVVFLQKPLESK